MGGIEGAATLEKAFNKTYGLNLQFKYTPGPAMPQFASRIIQEAKAGQPSSTDLFVGSENHVARMSLKSVDWSKTFNHITAPMIDFDNKVLIVTTRTPGFTFNSKMVVGKDIPQRVEDVLNPKWKGKIASTPYAASFDRSVDDLGRGENHRVFGKIRQAGHRADPLRRRRPHRRRRVRHAGLQLRSRRAPGSQGKGRAGGRPGFQRRRDSCPTGMSPCRAMRAMPTRRRCWRHSY